EPSLRSNLLHVLLVENLKRQTKTGFEFVLPLVQHRRRAADNDLAGLLPQEKLARDQAGFDGFDETDVVRDEQIDARQPQGFPQWFQLVGVKTDARSKGRLEQTRICGNHAIPPQRVQVGGKQMRAVKSASCDSIPRFIGEDFAVNL